MRLPFDDPPTTVEGNCGENEASFPRRNHAVASSAATPGPSHPPWRGLIPGCAEAATSATVASHWPWNPSVPGLFSLLRGPGPANSLLPRTTYHERERRPSGPPDHLRHDPARWRA